MKKKCSPLAMKFGSATFDCKCRKQVLGEENVPEYGVPSFSYFFTFWGTHLCFIVFFYIFIVVPLRNSFFVCFFGLLERPVIVSDMPPIIQSP